MNNDSSYRMRPALGRKTPIADLLICVGGSLFVTLILEMILRGGVQPTVDFAKSSPVVLFANWMLVALTYAIALMFRKKTFYAALVTLLWALLGVAIRVTSNIRADEPFNASDLVPSAADLLALPDNFGFVQLMAGGVLLMCAVIGLVVLYHKVSVFRRDKFMGTLRVAVSAFLLCVSAAYCLTSGVLGHNSQLTHAQAYQKRGLPIGFVLSAAGAADVEALKAEAAKQITYVEKVTKADGAYVQGGVLYVIGSGFENDYLVKVNGVLQDTVFDNATLLKVNDIYNFVDVVETVQVITPTELLAGDK